MYEEFYGFTGRPFQLTPDPAYYFESATHRKALSYLSYGLGQGEGFIVVTGEIGAGKSILAAHLQERIDPERLTAAHMVASALDAEQAVHVVANALGLPVAGRDKASALAAIERFLQDEARAGRRVLLVVDEVQNLSIAALEELRLLSALQLGAHPLLQVLLLGQPEFRELLATAPGLEQLRQRVIAAHHLTPMEPNEVGAYVEHRLKCVGWTGSNPGIDQRVHAELAVATGGVPRRINQVAARLLLLGAVEQRARIDAAMLKTVLADMARDQPAAIDDVPEIAPVARPVAPVPSAAQADLPLDLAAALAARDEQIAELQAAVIELAEMRQAAEPVADPRIAASMAVAEALQARCEEHEATLRHVLTMLIEWFEADDHRRAA